MKEEKAEKSFGELPTLGHEEQEKPEQNTAPEGPSWTELGLSQAATLKPKGGIVDDGRTDAARRWRAGEAILGRYVVEGELGQGGMGVVYGCLDKVGGVKVAVKCLPPELGHNSVEMEEVRENFQLVCGLAHPNIAVVRQLERDEKGEYYLVMELAEGECLRRWLRAKWKAGGVSLSEAVGVLRQVASALDYAHGEKVVHRDVKPGNVMIDGKGRVKVLDFGLAAQIRTSLSRASHAYRGTSGTGPYMAPEQWRAQPQDAKTDQYALGVMAYEMLAGRLPFENPEMAVLKDAVLNGEVAGIPDVPEGPMAALRRAMAKRAEERFGSCGEFVEALEGRVKRAGEGEEQKADSTGKETGEKVFLLKVRLEKVLAEAEKEKMTFADRSSFGKVEELYTAGEEALRVGQMEVAGKLLDQTERAMVAWWKVIAMRRIEEWRVEKVRREREQRLEFVRREEERRAEAKRRQEAEAARKSTLRRKKKKREKKRREEEKRKTRELAEAEIRKDAEGIRQVEEGLFDDVWTGMERGPERKLADAETALASVRKEVEGKRAEMERREEDLRRAQDRLEWLTRQNEARDAAIRQERERQDAEGNVFLRKVRVGKALEEAEREEATEGEKAELGRVRVMFAAGEEAIRAGDRAAAAALYRQAEEGLAAWRTHLAARREAEARTETERRAEERRLEEARKEAERKRAEEAAARRRKDRVRMGKVFGGLALVGVLMWGVGAVVRSLQGTWRAWRVAKDLGQGTREGETKSITLPGGATMELVWCPPGSFTMGSTNGADDEKPPHEVTLTKGFWMAKTEVTQAQWKSVMGDTNNPSEFKGDDLPVECVSWKDCQAFCRKTGLSLPTEAQWEYACRAGTAGDYGGTGDLESMGWHSGNSGNKTHPVGQKEANAWGLKDMHGNVGEWCADWYDSGYYAKSPGANPEGPASGENRVLRGGGSWFVPLICRSASRGGSDPGYRFRYNGFRPVARQD